MFGRSTPDHRSTVAIDIGSSSVGVAVVCIHPDNTTETLWSHREQCLIHDDASAEVQIRQIKTALTNAFLELNQTGLQILRDSDHSNDISEVQATISAPWSHTITKTISMKDEAPFVVDQELTAELVASAHEQSQLVFATNKLASTLGLKITHGDVLGVTINGYPVSDPLEQKGTEVDLAYMETAISEGISETLHETVQKFFPKATQSEYSFMYAFYLTMHNLRPNTSEICLIDVTGEATEVGIVRDSVLQYTTFIPYGFNTIAREISQISGVPKQEALSYLKESPQDMEARLSEKDKANVMAALDEYEEQVANMFTRTGDSLTIPKTTFLHSDQSVNAFFVKLLEKAAQKVIHKNHTVHPVTSKVLKMDKQPDTALEIGINFIAKKTEYSKLLPNNL